MKISKETFIEAINNIEKQHVNEINFSLAVNSYFSEDLDNSLPRNYIVDSLVKILQQHFQDENANSWIEYYLWELDFGKKDCKITVKDEPFTLKTPEHLYNLLNLE